MQGAIKPSLHIFKQLKKQTNRMKKTLKFKRFLEMNERKRIGENVREERKKKGLTQEMLAEKAGMQRINISRIEQGKCSTGFDTLQRIAEALDMKVDFVKKSIITQSESQ